MPWCPRASGHHCNPKGVLTRLPLQPDEEMLENQELVRRAEDAFEV